MKHRAHQRSREHHDELNRGDYRDDFGPEGRRYFARPTESRRHQHGDEHNERAAWEHRREQLQWDRGRDHGGFGSEYDAWSSGAGLPSAGFGFGPDERPDRGADADQDWQVTRPARGRGAWAGDWASDDHRGRGPKGYRRSDERIREEICELLSDDWSVDASEIVVEVRDGEVTLSGEVPSREQKHRARECVERVRGVDDVFNQLHVTRRDEQPYQSRRGSWR
jgi:hypothetical protein